ncbi:flagellar basal body P-ring formation chaperone FlgA [Benzoatithermus flavus]|uniref:Flagella basal body P-ring formation protein FlgA n=1 Tax=Benzoatithermus flavus TaxID=3108223 RepID=A0ABU8XUY7_9PROT
MARAEPLSSVERRLEALVGIGAGQGRYIVDWTEAVPADSEVADLRWNPRERTVTASIKDGSGREVTGRVRLLAEVPTPIRPIPQGALVTAADLGIMDLDLLTAHRETVTDEAQVEGHAARRRLDPGRPILARDLKLVPAVERGQLVTIVAGTERVTVRAKAKALDAGEIGQSVRVQNVDSRMVTSGIVVERGLVDVSGGRS